MENIDGVMIHQLLHLFEVGGILIAISLAITALKRPKFTIKGIVKDLNDLQLKR